MIYQVKIYSHMFVYGHHSRGASSSLQDTQGQDEMASQELCVIYYHFIFPARLIKRSVAINDVDNEKLKSRRQSVENLQYGGDHPLMTVQF